MGKAPRNDTHGNEEDTGACRLTQRSHDNKQRATRRVAFLDAKAVVGGHENRLKSMWQLRQNKTEIA